MNIRKRIKEIRLNLIYNLIWLKMHLLPSKLSLNRKGTVYPFNCDEFDWLNWEPCYFFTDPLNLRLSVPAVVTELKVLFNLDKFELN